MERVERIELSYSAWKAGALPLCYTRFRYCVLAVSLRRGDYYGKSDFKTSLNLHKSHV